jgi:hypothetical protein
MTATWLRSKHLCAGRDRLDFQTIELSSRVCDIGQYLSPKLSIYSSRLQDVDDFWAMFDAR